MVVYVSTPQDLDNIRNDLSGSYELTNDIDMSSFGNWTAIGSYAEKFTGQLNGNGFRIRNLTINIDTSYYGGLFGYVENATIINLGLTDVNITTGGSYLGALVGRADRSTIERCYATGNITGDTQWSQYIGGLMGSVFSGTIRNSYSHVNITDTRQYVGGFVGQAGVFLNSDINFRNCFSTGSITNYGANTGGFIGSASNITTRCYWDTGSSGMPTSAGGAFAKTTEQMKTASTFSAWNSEIWSLQDGRYPTLKIFGEEIVSIIEDRNVVSYSNSINSSLMLNKIATKKTVASIEEFSADVQKTIKAVKVGTTFVKDIVSGASRSVQIIKVGKEEVTSYILPITSDVETLRRQAKIMTETVTSHVNGVASEVYREIKSLRQALSFIDVIVGRAITPKLRPKEINAIVSHIENGTLSEYLNSKYNLSIYENLSDENDMQNMSNVNVLLNQTIVEVRD